MVKGALLAASLAVLSGSLARAENYLIPAGTTLHCRLTQTLDTRLNHPDDPLTATVAEPLIIDGHDVVPAGTKLEGRISRLQRPGRIRGVGEMRLSANKIILPDGHSFPLNAILVSTYEAEGAKVVGGEGTVKGPSSRLKTLEEIGGGAAAGGVIGLLFHHSVLGMAIGSTAGFVDRVRRRGQDLTLPRGTQLNYQLTRELVIQR
jgi:type IV secretion system protein VirB10